MKIGFIGFGKSVNRYHAPFVSQLKDSEVIGYYAKGGNQFEMIYPDFKDLIKFESLDDLFDSEVELVIISTPPQFHYQYAKDCIEHGKHVIVEKPMTDTLEQGIELYRLAQENNVIFSPYQNRRFDSDFLDIKLAIAEYELGDIIEIESNHTQYRKDNLDRKGDKYGGFVYGHAVHFIDQIVSLFGIPDDMLYDFTNQKDYYLGGSGNLEDYYNITLIYGNMRVRVRYSQLVVKEPPRWIINGLNATVEKYQIDNQERDLKQGIFPFDEGFAKDPQSAICKVYYADGSEKEVVQDNKVLYTEFYKQMIVGIHKGIAAPVKREEALCVIHLLETIVNKRTYNKAEFLEIIK